MAWCQLGLYKQYTFKSEYFELTFIARFHTETHYTIPAKNLIISVQQANFRGGNIRLEEIGWGGEEGGAAKLPLKQRFKAGHCKPQKRNLICHLSQDNTESSLSSWPSVRTPFEHSG